MPLRQTLRALVTARLTEAAEDIFELFERTIAEYEEELCQKSLRGLEDRVKAVEQELSRALLSQNTTVSHSLQRGASSSVTVDGRTAVSAIGNSATAEGCTPVAAFGTSTAVEEHTAVFLVGTSAAVEERAAVPAVRTGADVIQSAWRQVFTNVDELLSCARTLCIFCAKQKLGNEAHLLHKHLKEAMYFVSNNTEQFVIACFCQEKPLDHRRSHYHCPFCNFRAFSRDSTFRKHLSGVHGIIGSKKSGVYPSLLCPALAQNQEIPESPQMKVEPEEQSKVKQEEEQLQV